MSFKGFLEFAGRFYFVIGLAGILLVYVLGVMAWGAINKEVVSSDFCLDNDYNLFGKAGIKDVCLNFDENVVYLRSVECESDVLSMLLFQDYVKNCRFVSEEMVEFRNKYSTPPPDFNRDLNVPKYNNLNITNLDLNSDKNARFH